MYHRYIFIKAIDDIVKTFFEIDKDLQYLLSKQKTYNNQYKQLKNLKRKFQIFENTTFQKFITKSQLIKTSKNSTYSKYFHILVQKCYLFIDINIIRLFNIDQRLKKKPKAAYVTTT